MTPEDHHASIISSFLSHNRYEKPASPPSNGPPTHVKPKTCVYCKKPHSSNECTTVKDSVKRWEIVKEQKLRFNCLGHHKSSAYQSKFRCHTCKGKHHTSLCTEGLAKPEPKPDNTTGNKNPPGTVVHTTMTPIAQLSVPSNTVTLLKTAVATIRNQTTCCEANILFNEGAQRSFITQDLANQLQPTNREFISVSGFGAQTSPTRSLESTVTNLKTSNNVEIPLQVLSVERIATPLHLHSCHNIKIPYLKGIQLARPVTSDEDFEISLLVGADQYCGIVEDQVICGNVPTAVKSKVSLEADQTTRSVVNSLQLSSTKQDEYDLEQFWSSNQWG